MTESEFLELADRTLNVIEDEVVRAAERGLQHDAAVDRGRDEHGQCGKGAGALPTH